MPLDPLLHPLLEHARAEAPAQGLAYAGAVSPQDAWALASSGQAVLVDVRSNEERTFVGYVPGSLHLPWASGTALIQSACTGVSSSVLSA